MSGSDDEEKGRDFDATSLATFMKNKGIVEGIIDQIVQATNTTLHLVEESKASFDPAKEAEISESLVRVSRSVTGFAKKAKGMLDDMQKIGKDMVTRFGKDDRTYQVFKMHYDRLVKKYVDAVKAFQKAKSDAVDAGKSTLTRRAQVFFPDETEEEIAKRIEENPRNFIQAALTEEVANERVQQLYRDVTSRAREMEILANSIREVYEMFQDFAVLVQQQHEQIDNIETTIEQASQHVQAGNIELQKAIEYQKKIRKKYCCIAIVVVIVLCIVGGVFGGISKKL